MVKSLRAPMELLGKSSPKMLQGGPVPMVIVDGGIASAENLALLRAEGFDYLVNDSRRRRERYTQEFLEDETFSVITGREQRQPARVRMLQEKHEVVNGDTNKNRFHSLKSDLGLRPNFHQKESRVDGHVFITILAYQLWCFIRMTLRNNNDPRSWETIRRVLRTHCYATIVLPTKNGRTYRIRRASTPDQSQLQIYKLFDIDCKTLPRSRTRTP